MPFFNESSEELRTLSGFEKNIIALTVLGGFFACFDFTVYFFFSDAINKAFFPNASNNWLQSTGFILLLIIGYVSRPLGGIIMADFGDRLGRRKVLLISLITLAFSTLLIALLPTYDQIGITAVVLLLILRVIQGFGFGAEVPASWVYLAEHMPRRHIGLALGTLVSMFVLSTLLANVLSNLLSSMLTPKELESYGWRIPFILGALGTFFSIALRYRMRETPSWLMAKREQLLVTKTPLRLAFAQNRYGMLMTFALSWFTSSIFIIVLLIIPELALRYFDAPTNLMAFSNGMGIFFAALGAVIFGYLADRYNTGKVFFIGCILLAASSWLFFTTLKNSNELLLLTYAIMGFFAGIIGIIPSICIRLFPVGVRMSGVAFCYNVAYAITGALTPYLLNYFSTKVSYTALLYTVFLCILGAILGMLITNLHGLYRLEKRRHDLVTEY